MKVNIKTISEMTGFSQATVSNVLNNKKGIKRETMETVMKTAKEIGYLNTPKLENIRLVMYEKSGEVLTETPLIKSLLAGVEQEARLHGLSTVVHTIRESDADFEHKLSQILNLHNSGVILLATEMEWEDIKPFQAMECPLVVVDAWFREGHFDTILMSNTDSFYNSVSFLADKGHQSIGFIDSTIPIRNFKYRKRGFKNAIEDYNLTVPEEACLSLYPTMLGAYEDMKQYLSGKPKLPTAFCAVNDIIAIGAMRALQEYGYKIPEDLSIIGFDNMPFCEMASPGLTTVDIFKTEMGQLAVKRILEKYHNPNTVPAKIQLLTQLYERNSVKNMSIK